MTNPATPARLVSNLTVEIDLPPTRDGLFEDDKTERWFMANQLTLTYARTYTDPETEGAASAITATIEGHPLDGKTKKPLRVTYTDETGFPDGVVEYVTRYNPDKTN